MDQQFVQYSNPAESKRETNQDELNSMNIMTKEKKIEELTF